MEHGEIGSFLFGTCKDLPGISRASRHSATGNKQQGRHQTGDGKGTGRLHINSGPALSG